MVAGEGLHAFFGANVPQLSRVVTRAGNEKIRVFRRQRDGHYATGVSDKLRHLRVLFKIPKETEKVKNVKGKK